MKHIVKRRGHTEEYDERKLYASIYFACAVANSPNTELELVASKVVGDVERWLEEKHEVTSKDIFTQALKHLRVYNETAAYMYEHHTRIC